MIIDLSSDAFALEDALFIFVWEFQVFAFEAFFRHLIKDSYFCTINFYLFHRWNYNKNKGNKEIIPRASAVSHFNFHSSFFLNCIKYRDNYIHIVIKNCILLFK